MLRLEAPLRLYGTRGSSRLRTRKRRPVKDSLTIFVKIVICIPSLNSSCSSRLKHDDERFIRRDANTAVRQVKPCVFDTANRRSRKRLKHRKAACCENLLAGRIHN